MSQPEPYIYEHLISSRAPKAEPPAKLSTYPFIGGHNDPELIPTEALAKAADAVIKREGHKLAIYNLGEGPYGYPGMRKFLADKLRSHRGFDLSPDDILITSGSGQGIELVNKVLIEPGDTVVMEDFTYQTSINKARGAGATVVGIELDREGIRLDILEEKLEGLRQKGVVPKYIYVIPTIQNPTGSILSLERRQKLIALSTEYGVPIFEDECYADLAWSADAPPALAALAPGQVIHIGSLSKTLAPALRIGYATADPRFLGRMLACKTDGGTGALDQMIAAEYFEHYFDDHMVTMKAALKEKLDVMVDAFEREFGTDADLWIPQGGIFLWLKLPDQVDVRRFAQTALKAGVTFNGGPEWACSGERAKNYLRVCFALPDKAKIRAGVAALAKACFEETGFPPRGDNRARA